MKVRSIRVVYTPDKSELAIEDVAYAKGDYEKEMEQTALLNEAIKSQ